MLSEDKFFEKAEKFALYPSVDGSTYYTYEELIAKIKDTQTDKDDKTVILYASDKEAQHSYINAAKAKGYEVLLLDSPIVPHLLQKLETSKEKIAFARVDADHIDNLIKKEVVSSFLIKLSIWSASTLAKAIFSFDVSSFCNK